MEKRINMKRASASYFVASLFNKGIAFLTVPIFTRLLSTADYGIVTTYNSWILILTTVIGFALHTSIRIAFIDYRDKMEDYLSTIATFTLLSGWVFSAIIYFVCCLFKLESISILLILCLLQSIASALIEDYSMYLMMQYRYMFRTILMVLPNLISVVISVIAIKFLFINHLYLGRIIPNSIVIIAFGVFVCFLVYRKSRKIFHAEYIKYALNVSMPLILHGIALTILAQSDRTMITWLTNSTQTGIYSLIYNFSMIATVITTSLEGIWVPWFYRRLQEKKTIEINSIAKGYINLMAYSMIAVIMIGPEMVKILTVSSYWDGIKIIPPIVISNYIIFAYTLYVNIEHYHKKTKGITLNTIIAAMVNILLNYFSIPKYGYVAAAFTTLVSYLIAFVLHAIKAKKLEPELYPITYFIAPFIEMVIATLLFYFFVDSAIIRWGMIMFFMIIMIIVERKRIRGIFFIH